MPDKPVKPPINEPPLPIHPPAIPPVPLPPPIEPPHPDPEPPEPPAPPRKTEN